MLTNILKDQIVIITGGAGTIGIELLKAVIKNKGIAVIADKNTELGKSLENQLNNEYGEESAYFIELDITCKRSIERMIYNTNCKFGKIDALVNNAYPRNDNYGRKFFNVEFEDFAENIKLHLGGYFLSSQQIALYFQDQGYGNILNISSIYGVIPPKFDLYEGTDMTMPVEYAVIKSSINHLTKYMAKTFKGMNIRVNSLSPGGIYVSQPQSFVHAYNQECLNKGMLEPSDLNGTFVYLLSEMSKFVNGQNIIVDDGFTL